MLPKPPRQAYKAISNFPTNDNDDHEHEHEHDQSSSSSSSSSSPSSSLSLTKHQIKRKRDVCKNESNRPFANHLNDLSDMYLNCISNNDMIRMGLDFNRKANQIRNEDEELSSLLLHDQRRYKKIRPLYNEFITTNTTTLMNDLMKDVDKVSDK